MRNCGHPVSPPTCPNPQVFLLNGQRPLSACESNDGFSGLQTLAEKCPRSGLWDNPDVQPTSPMNNANPQETGRSIKGSKLPSGTASAGRANCLRSLCRLLRCGNSPRLRKFRGGFVEIDGSQKFYDFVISCTKVPSLCVHLVYQLTWTRALKRVQNVRAIE